MLRFDELSFLRFKTLKAFSPFLAGVPLLVKHFLNLGERDYISSVAVGIVLDVTREPQKLLLG